jgi:hypothetical protein
MTARSLVLAVLAGVLIALLVPSFLSQLSLGVTGLDASIPVSDSMAQVLKNIARRGAGGYKSLWAAPTTSLLRPATSVALNLAPFTANMSTQKTFFDAVKDRRSIYQLNKEAPISDKQISDIVEKALLHVPSSFNSQSTRLVVLLNKDHETFWEFVLEVLKPLTPEEQFPKTEQKVNGFKAAYGTVSLTSTCSFRFAKMASGVACS